jgi:hypothetical protein
MPQPLLPLFHSDATQINELVSFAKRDGTVYYFNGALPVSSHARRYRQKGVPGFFKSRTSRQPRVLTPLVLQKAQELFQQGQERNVVVRQLRIKSGTLRKAIQDGQISEPIKKK